MVPSQQRTEGEGGAVGEGRGGSGKGGGGSGRAAPEQGQGRKQCAKEAEGGTGNTKRRGSAIEGVEARRCGCERVGVFVRFS